MRKANRIAQAAATTAHQLELPSIFAILDVGPSREPDRIRYVRMKFLNSGRTEARIKHFGLNCLIAESLHAPTAISHVKVPPPDRTIIGPNGGEIQFTWPCREIWNTETVAGVQNQSVSLWAYGALVYTDRLGDEHTYRFCGRWLNDRFKARFVHDCPPNYTSQT
jgi:hypothetical protein